MQSHMAILIAYCIGMKKDHQTLLNFAILAGNGKKRTFSYKVALKIVMVGPKGGIAPWPSPKYATVVGHYCNRYMKTINSHQQMSAQSCT